MTKSIGIDIGGTNFRIGIFEQLELLSEARIQTNFSALCEAHSAEAAWEKILNVIADAVNDALVQHPDIKHIGIGFPGFIDPVDHVISTSPNLPGINNANLATDLALRLKEGFQAITIVVENDALAAAYGEYYLAERKYPSLLYIGLGTGVGGGLILSGQPYKGSHGMAMEVGHMIVTPSGKPCGCGNLGCLEQYASASAVETAYFEATAQKESAHNIAELARAGDHAAMTTFQRAGESLAIAVAHVLKVVDVPTILIGGGLSQAWDLIQASFDSSLQTNLIPALRGKTNIIISSAGDKAGMLGAAQLAVDTA